MIMEFFKEIFAKHNSAPEKIKLKFKALFPKAKGVEWFKLANGMEAIFNEGGKEKIGIFSHDGTLLELRTNLPLELIPENIRLSASKQGEIMNCISINVSGAINYELIVRDIELKRFRIFSDNNGHITAKTEL